MSAPLLPKRVTEGYASLPVPYETGRTGDQGWRTLGANGNGRELPQYLQDRMLVNSFKAFRTNPMAKRLIEIQNNFILGSGLSVNSQDELVAAAIYQWWNDSYNSWPTKIVRRVRDLGIYGEWLHRPLRGSDGFVRIADVQPDVISLVAPDPLDHGECDKVYLKELVTPGGVQKEVPVDVIRRRLRSTPKGYDLDADYTGDLFYFGINKTSDSLRGVGELFTVLDYIDVYDDMLFARAEKLKLMNKFFWDISVDGMTESELQQWLAKQTDLPPKTGSVFAHNAAIAVQAIVPDLKADDHSVDASLIKSHIVSSSGWPGTWFDDPGTAGRAVGAEMAEPALRNIVNLQAQVGAMLRVEIDYHLWSLEKSGNGVGKNPEYTLSFNKPSARDIAKVGPALKNLILGIKEATGAMLLSQEEGRQLIVSAANQLGISDLPLSMELPAELAAKAAQAEKMAEQAMQAKANQPEQSAKESIGALPAVATRGSRRVLWGAGTN